MTEMELNGYTQNEQELWNRAFEKIDRALFRRNLEKAMSILQETLDRSHPIEGAIPRHFTLLKILEKMYLLRNEDSVAYHMCLAICDCDLVNAENLFRVMNRERFEEEASSQGDHAKRPFYMITPTKKAIILEKLGDVQGALEVCETALRWNVWDTGKKTFHARIDALKKKL